MISAEKVISMVSKALEAEEGSITLNTKSSDLPEWDSLGHLAILSQISEDIGDQYNESQELASSSSVQEIFDCLNKTK
jgi:acyl carrier protein